MRGLAVIITVRERYGYTKDCVESVLSGLPAKVPVVFSGGRIPGPVLSYLKRKSRARRGFSLIAKDRFLFGNDARILALGKVPAKSDLLFLENDVVPQKGWLAPLLKCADQERAGMVSPLLLEGVPGSGQYQVHITGLEAVREGGPKGPLRELRFHANHSTLPDRLVRESFDALESHCFWVRREVLERAPLEPGMDPMFAHLDLCFRVGALGKKMFVEPGSRMVFANPKFAPLRHKEDLETFLEVWGERRWVVQESDFHRRWGFHPKSRIIWGHQEWSMINKEDVFRTLGVLGRWSFLLLRLSRIKACPTFLRKTLEDRLASRVLERAAWEPWRT